MKNKLATYVISVDFMSSASFEVEARTEEEALEKVQSLAEEAVRANEFEPGDFSFDLIDIVEED